MVARITHPQSLHRAIYYNEHKVTNDDAKNIHSANFLIDTDRLTLIDKKERFDRLKALNPAPGRTTLHVSLNFDPSEKLSRQKLVTIAVDYMDRIGFGKQPYLVYQHLDAAHPHVHIVSTNVQADGTLIDMHNIGKDKSEAARKEIEKKYHLVRAEDQKKMNKTFLQPLNVEKLQYGKSETKRSITNVLDYVLQHFKYCSLPELNAVLKLYNLHADPGKPGGRIHKHKGLVYQMLDEKGQGVGVRIKASSIYSNPGLAYLAQKFLENKAKRQPDLKRMRTGIDWVIRSSPGSWDQLVRGLKKEQIHPVPYINKQGMMYGLTFIDFQTKAVATGSHIGKNYSAKAILARIGLDQHLKLLPVDHRIQKAGSLPSLVESLMPNCSATVQGINKTIDILMQQEDQSEKLPFELRKEQKKKKPPTRSL